MLRIIHSSHTHVFQHSHSIKEAAPLWHPVFPHLYSVPWLSRHFIFTDCLVLIMSLGCGARIHYYLYPVNLYEVSIVLE